MPNPSTLARDGYTFYHVKVEVVFDILRDTPVKAEQYVSQLLENLPYLSRIRFVESKEDFYIPSYSADSSMD